jgi:hypothetical protein
MSHPDTETLLDKWYDAKQEIAILEKKIDKYKKAAENIMNESNSDVLSSSKYYLSRREMNKTTIGKKDLPEDIWNRFSKETFYNAFYISKKNEKKRSPGKNEKKRSPK